MIWASVSFQSYFHWLYRVSPSLAAKNIINLISVLTIWWCPCVESSFVLLEEGVCYDQCILLQNSVSLCPTSFCIPRTNLSVTPGVSWLPTFAFQAAMMKVKVQEGLGLSLWLSNTKGDSTLGHHQMVNTEIRLIIYFAAKDGEALYSRQKKE